MTERFPDAPPRIKALPRDGRGFPIPWFVATQPDGTRDFRVASLTLMEKAFRHHLCWICGQPLGRFVCFAIGPMCTINRVTSEPPSHTTCAEFAVVACPFLSRPLAKRDYKGMEGTVATAGVSIDRNPGVTALWYTHPLGYKRIKVDADPVTGANAGRLVSLSDPDHVTWWREGRKASRSEVEASIASGLPALVELAEKQGAMNQLKSAVRTAAHYYPEGA
jgi:hypothetical protein